MTRLLPLFCIILFCFGCGPKLPSDLPPLYPATLVIMQEGKPLDNALVTMAKADYKWTITGRTNVQGEAVMSVNGMYDGAPEGEFKVIVYKAESETPNMPPPPTTGDPHDEALYNERIAPLVAQTKTFSLVESKYTDLDTTSLSVMIVRGTPSYSLDVGKAVRMIIPR